MAARQSTGIPPVRALHTDGRSRDPASEAGAMAFVKTLLGGNLAVEYADAVVTASPWLHTQSIAIAAKQYLHANLLAAIKTRTTLTANHAHKLAPRIAKALAFDDPGLHTFASGLDDLCAGMTCGGDDVAWMLHNPGGGGNEVRGRRTVQVDASIDSLFLGRAALRAKRERLREECQQLAAAEEVLVQTANAADTLGRQVALHRRRGHRDDSTYDRYALLRELDGGVEEGVTVEQEAAVEEEIAAYLSGTTRLEALMAGESLPDGGGGIEVRDLRFTDLLAAKQRLEETRKTEAELEDRLRKLTRAPTEISQLRMTSDVLQDKLDRLQGTRRALYQSLREAG
ncbi:hypothetical protein PYCC9005_003365 [Savitreella phatthalungensis]